MTYDFAQENRIYSERSGIVIDISQFAPVYFGMLYSGMLAMARYDKRLMNPLRCCGYLHLPECGCHKIFDGDKPDPRTSLKPDAFTLVADAEKPKRRLSLRFLPFVGTRMATEACTCKHDPLCPQRVKSVLKQGPKWEISAGGSTFIRNHDKPTEEAAA